MNIDRIAREMVDVEPSVDLEARIRARVRAARPASTPAWWTWRVGAVLATAAAAVTLALVVQRPWVSVPEPVSVTAQLPNISTSQVSSTTSPLRTFQPVRHHSDKQSKQQPLSEEELAWMERRMPALDPLNALQVDRLRVDSIQPEPLTITPLTMTPVATEGGGIERRNDR